MTTRGNKALLIIGTVFTAVGVVFIGVSVILYINLRINLILLPFSIVGTVFAILGAVFLYVARPKDKHNLWLIQNGRYIEAEIVDIEKNTAYSVNGKNPFMIVCRHEENGINYIYRSEGIWVYPELSTNSVGVYINPDNEKDYYVSIESAIKPSVEL